jgi:hypothetical protein
MREDAATSRGLQRHREPRSTSFWSAACPLSPAGYCAARGPRAHHRVAAWISWLTGRGQQSDSYAYLSSVTRHLPELASLSSFARILKAYHLLQLETYPPM